MLPGMYAVDCNLQVAINESCVLERHSWNRKTFLFSGRFKGSYQRPASWQKSWHSSSRSLGQLNEAFLLLHTALMGDSGWILVAAGLNWRVQDGFTHMPDILVENSGRLAQLGSAPPLRLESKPPHLVSLAVLGLLMWQLRAAGSRVEAARPSRPGPENRRHCALFVRARSGSRGRSTGSTLH